MDWCPWVTVLWFRVGANSNLLLPPVGQTEWEDTASMLTECHRSTVIFMPDSQLANTVTHSQNAHSLSFLLLLWMMNDRFLVSALIDHSTNVLKQIFEGNLPRLQALCGYDSSMADREQRGMRPFGLLPSNSLASTPAPSLSFNTYVV